MSEQPKSSSESMKITFDQFTEVTLNAVLRAIEARRFPGGPIIIGIIYNPQGLPGEVIGRQVGSTTSR
jgi:hypothetical protein